MKLPNRPPNLFELSKKVKLLKLDETLKQKIIGTKYN
jgi:hypothetical protein